MQVDLHHLVSKVAVQQWSIGLLAHIDIFKYSLGCIQCFIFNIVGSVKVVGLGFMHSLYVALDAGFVREFAIPSGSKSYSDWL